MPTDTVEGKFTLSTLTCFKSSRSLSFLSSTSSPSSSSSSISMSSEEDATLLHPLECASDSSLSLLPSSHLTIVTSSSPCTATLNSDHPTQHQDWPEAAPWQHSACTAT